MRLIPCVLLLLLLAACSTPAPAPVGPEPQKVQLDTTHTLRLPMPPAPGFPDPFEVAQTIWGTQPDGTLTRFQARLSVAPALVKAVLLDDLGRRALTLTWGPDTFAIDRAPWLPAEVEGPRMLADLMMVYWPLSIVQAALDPPLSATQSTDGTDRRILSNGVPYIHISRPPGNPWPGPALLENQALGYQLKIHSVVIEEPGT